MKCVSALSRSRKTDEALGEILEQGRSALGDTRPDLAFLFVTPHHAEQLGTMTAALRQAGLARHVLGCTCESIVGAGEEVEDTSGISLWAIELPGAEITPLHLEFADGAIRGWDDALNRAAPDARTLFLLGDPFGFPIDRLFRHLSERSPGLRVCGGMASGAHEPGLNRLVMDDETHSTGAVGVLVDAPLTIRTVVSQGCRPIGRPLLVTRAEQNIIRDLGRRPALEVLREIFEELEPDDQERVQQGLHIGRVINEYQEVFRRGDFLVRNVLGADDQGGIAITDLVRVGQTVQFHVRDAETASEDLRSLLKADSEDRPGRRPVGALLFSCNGRGTRLFDRPNHDIGQIQEIYGPIPVAGFFAMGELGPIGGQNFVHGYTASVVLFESESASEA